jgi:hypothetical protein
MTDETYVSPFVDPPTAADYTPADDALFTMMSYNVKSKSHARRILASAAINGDFIPDELLDAIELVLKS